MDYLIMSTQISKEKVTVKVTGFQPGRCTDGRYTHAVWRQQADDQNNVIELIMTHCHQI